MNDIIQKTREDYNKIAKHFSDTRYDIWHELKQFEAYIKDGQNILDWGCGNGRLILLLNGHSVKYFGLDQSSELIKIARKKHAAAISAGWVKFFCTALRQKLFPDNYFDLAFMIASFHHLPDKISRIKLLKKMYRELKPGARLIMTNWNLDSDWANKKKQSGGWKEIGDNDYLIPWKNPQGVMEAERYYHHFAKEEIRDLLNECGFAVEKNDYDHEINWTDDKKGNNLITVARKQ